MNPSTAGSRSPPARLPSCLLPPLLQPLHRPLRVLRLAGSGGAGGELVDHLERRREAEVFQGLDGPQGAEVLFRVSATVFLRSRAGFRGALEMSLLTRRRGA